METQMINLILNAVLVSLVVYFMHYKTNQMQEGLETLHRDLSGLKLLADIMKNSQGLQIEQRDNGVTCYCLGKSGNVAPSKPAQLQPSLATSFPNITQGSQGSQKSIDDAVSGKELISIMEEVQSKGFRVEPFVGDIDMYFAYPKKDEENKLENETDNQNIQLIAR